ncbi:hypothetical protein [Streptomyces violaceorubidus]|uniref:hypothetical protein n=1 Tax=Streptomyces violaceorubidus TaxID=284042 RepID=UPI0004BEC124|nr:hypothetical protein [Streptomyces violaceorubidus]
MRLTITSGGCTVDIRTDPGEGVSLRAAEKAALRLFHALPPSDDTTEDEQPFGFALSSDTERAPETPDTVEYEDDE